MSNTPCTTIGLGVYNGERFIADAIESILAQDYRDFELVISDNASTDQTEAICARYVHSSSNVRYFRNETNRGYAYNFNRLPTLARGKYFKWACADDVLEPQFLSRCVDVLDSNPDVVLAFTKFSEVDENLKPKRPGKTGLNLESTDPLERLKRVIQHGGHWADATPLFGVIRLAALRQTRLLPKYHGGDKVTIGELSTLGRFHEVPQSLLRRRHHAAAQSYNTSDVAWLREFFKTSDPCITMPTWHLYRDHLTTIHGSHLPRKKKLLLILATCRAAKWNVRELAGEFRNTCAYHGVIGTIGSVVRLIRSPESEYVSDMDRIPVVSNLRGENVTTFRK